MTRIYALSSSDSPLSVADVGGRGNISCQLRGLRRPTQWLILSVLEWQFVSLDGLKAVVGVGLLAHAIVGQRLLRSGRATGRSRIGGLRSGLSVIAILAAHEFDGHSLNAHAGSSSAILTDVRLGADSAFDEHLAALGEVLLADVAQLAPGSDAEVFSGLLTVITHVDRNIKVADGRSGAVAQGDLAAFRIADEVADDDGLIH